MYWICPLDHVPLCLFPGLFTSQDALPFHHFVQGNLLSSSTPSIPRPPHLGHSSSNLLLDKGAQESAPRAPKRQAQQLQFCSHPTAGHHSHLANMYPGRCRLRSSTSGNRIFCQTRLSPRQGNQGNPWQRSSSLRRPSCRDLPC